MDWSRAKTIFILSFLILDLFLAAQLHQMMEKKSRYLESNRINEEQIHDLLETNHIRLAVPFPKQNKNIPVLQASISSLGNWNHNAKWTYSKNFPKGIPFRNEKELLKILKQQVPFFADYRFAQHQSNANKRVYLQKQNDYAIFDGKLICHIKNGRIEAIDVLHFQKKKEVPVEFISFNNALANLIMSGKLPKNSTITSVELGYRSPYYTNPQEVILAPVWRVRVNQNYYYINATNVQTGTLNVNTESIH